VNKAVAVGKAASAFKKGGEDGAARTKAEADKAEADKAEADNKE